MPNEISFASLRLAFVFRREASRGDFSRIANGLTIANGRTRFICPAVAGTRTNCTSTKRNRIWIGQPKPKKAVNT